MKAMQGKEETIKLPKENPYSNREKNAWTQQELKFLPF